MNKTSINRTLWYQNDERRLTLSQAELRQQTRPLVILGEPGIGKTHLLEWLAAVPGYALCSARKLINRHDPRTLLRDERVLVIDALDEVLGEVGFVCSFDSLWVCLIVLSLT